MANVRDQGVLQLLGRHVSLDEYEEIRELWKKHSIAEDQRNLDGLISTLTEDCTYTMPQTGNVWSAHSGARQFYTELLTAFPDIHFDLLDIVIGPQGVCEEASVTATHMGQWLKFPATNQHLQFKVIIFFPWEPTKRKFRGEKIYIDSIDELIHPRSTKSTDT
jgi:predicted ester cyclase